MFSILEVLWSIFSNEKETANDLDGLLAVYEQHPYSVFDISHLFDFILLFKNHVVQEYEENFKSKAITTGSNNNNKSKRQTNDKYSKF